MAGQPKPRKGLPVNLDAEQAVLGALMIDPHGIRSVSLGLDPHDFWRESHRWIYTAILRLYQSQTAIDLLTVSDYLESKGYLNKISADGHTGVGYLMELQDRTPTSVHLQHYADIVSAAARRRTLLDLAERIAIDACDEATDLEDVLSKVETNFYTATTSKGDDGLADSSKLMSELYEEVELVSKRQGLAGISTGLVDVDKILGGMHNSDVIYLAARPAVGKTAAMLNIALAAGKAGKHTLIISLEMSALQLSQRLACIESGLSIHKLRQGKLEGNDWPRLIDAMGRIEQLPICVAYAGAYKPSQIRAIAHRQQAEHGLDLLCIDYLQLMTADDDRKNRREQVDDISRSLKLLARQLNVPLLALSQLSRGVETRVDKRPMLSDLRESGALEQDADVVAFLFRQEMYEPEATEVKGQMEWITAKHRNGPTGTSILHFRAHSGQVVSTKLTNLDGGLQHRMPLDEYLENVD